MHSANNSIAGHESRQPDSDKMFIWNVLGHLHDLLLSKNMHTTAHILEVALLTLAEDQSPANDSQNDALAVQPSGQPFQKRLRRK